MPRKQVTYSNHPNPRTRMIHAQGARQFRAYDTSHIRPRRSKAPVIFGAVLAVVVLVVAIAAITFAMKGCSAESAPVDGSQVVVQSTVQATIPSGSTASDVAKIVADAGVVPDSAAFLSRAKELGKDAQFQAGAYTFSAGMTLDDVIGAIASGNLGNATLTVPEGYKLSDIAAAVAGATEGRVSAEAFTAAASDASAYAADYAFLADAGTNSLEGFLFPKTYSLTPDDTADSIVRMMLSQFQTETASLDWSYPQSMGLSIYDAVNLASIVEKESSGSEQIRAQVAAVFYNRLDESNQQTVGFLQSDATTAYVVGHDPSAEEVHSDDPYSTYTYKGLPPTPICSPSLDCMMAVCAPAQDYADYNYFIFFNNDKGELDYVFSKTYEEHQAAVAEHL